MIVQKFGGSSVGSPAALGSVIKIVSQAKKNGNRPLLVCSALKGVTSRLQQLLTMASLGADTAEGLSEIENRHYEIVRSLGGVKCQERVFASLGKLFSELKALMEGVRALGEVSPRTQDRVMAYGELLSCSMITNILQQHVGSAVFADTRNLIKTNGMFGSAIVNLSQSHSLIRDFCSGNPDQIIVFTGFIASSENGDTTTLGRGGSDYTAAIVASALEAERIEIWTDVDGIMTADPAIVKKAFPVPGLTYPEATELSYFGARVIHSPTMMPARITNIPIIIRNTFNPSFSGTLISNSMPSGASLIRGISCIAEICLITVQGGGMVGRKGFTGRLFSALSHINVILITQASSQHSISVAVRPEELFGAEQAIRDEFRLEVAEGLISMPSSEEGMGIIAVVGENMRHTKGLSGRLFSALGRSGVNVVTIAQGSSELNISVVIDRDDLSKAMNAIHDAMFLSPVKTLNVFCIGLGNIGGTLLKQISEHSDYLEKERHLKVNIAGVCNSSRMLLNSEGIPPGSWEEYFSNEGEQGSARSFTERAIAMNLPNSVMVDNTGSIQVAGLYGSLFRSSFSVVACNKTGVSGQWERYISDKQLASGYGVDFWYETSVGAGLPILKTLYDLMISGDRILKIEAVLSGTISFIFNNYKGERSFASVVREAMEKGLTEPDPRDDLSGLDFIRKMLILARETGLEMDLEDINLQQLLPESCLNAESVEDFFVELEKAEGHFDSFRQKAASGGRALQFVGVLSEGKASVGLKMLDPGHPFYNMKGSDNIVSFTTNRYLNNPMVIKGPGAGAEVTAAGVMADLVRVGAH